MDVYEQIKELNEQAREAFDQDDWVLAYALLHEADELIIETAGTVEFLDD